VIVLDASVAVKLILTEAYSNRVIALLTSTVQAGDPIIAPTLLPYEVANILRQRMVRQGLVLPLADQLMADFLTFPIALQTSPTMHQRALAIADTYGLPAAYDAHYIALAEEQGADLWTDDQRLLRGLAGRVPFVHWIGNY
jgi:predicted nucleic acid-binding protein